VPAERHPEPPRLRDGLAVQAASPPPGDGDGLGEVEIAGAEWAGLRADGVECTEVVLADPDLSGAELVDWVLRDALLRNPNLANATIRGGTQSRVLVEGGRLTGIQVAEAELRDVVWRGCGADMAAFRHTRLAHVTFEDCNLREADFTGLRGVHVRFHDCDLRGAGFRHAELAACELRRCRLDGIEGVEGLRGAAIELDELVDLAPALARALGIELLVGRPSPV
jgi:uncharacterized protein YjbI with pentapeptide repeats